VDKTKTRLNAVVKQAKRKDVTELINACDAGREGELIFRLIEQYAGGAKGGLGKPVKRLWLQSMTPQAIRDGFNNLRSDAQMQGLASAARSRSEADWLVGINGTRAMTAFNSRDGGFFLTTVGRVQTPTLSLVVEREEKIRKFVSRDYWEVHGTFDAQAGQYLGKWFNPQWKKRTTPRPRPTACGTRPMPKPLPPPCRASRPGDRREQAHHAGIAPAVRPDQPAARGQRQVRLLGQDHAGAGAKPVRTPQGPDLPAYRLARPARGLSARGKQTFDMLATSGMRHLAPFAQQAINDNYIRPTKRVFDNSKVSDHFAIIPTTQAPSGLSEAEQKLYDLVVRRFMAVFFPSAEYQVTTRISKVEQHSFKTEGKVLVKPGWLAIYGKEAANEVEDAKEGDKGQPLVAVQPGEQPRTHHADVKGLKTKPPARYSEATLLGAMESAGKQIDDDELREAMQEKGLGTPATRAAIIEGLLTEKYMLREGRELIPTAKAFQLMTLLRGLEVEELCRADLTGEWEYKLSQMEKGQLSREAFMQQIQAMTEKLVKKAKEYDRDTIPGDYATLSTPCPNCGGVVKENYRRYACTGANGASEGCGFSFTKSPAGRTFETAEAEQLLRERRIGPLEGFRSKAGWPFVAEVAIVRDEENSNFKLEFDFGDDKDSEDTGEIVDFAHQQSLGPCPKCGSPVFEHGANYVCSKAVPTLAQTTPSCDFKSGQIILQQPIEREQMSKLLQTGKTDLLEKFVSNRTRRNFKAFLVWDGAAGKVNFEFEQREGKYPARKTAGAAAAKTTTAAAKKTGTAAKKTAAKTATKATTKTAAVKKPRTVSATLKPSADLAAVIGSEPTSRPDVIKKLWDYIKANGLQDAKDKRAINADAKLKPVFGKEQISMFELAGIVGKHVS
jgi:DNA topoisomerase-3